MLVEPFADAEALRRRLPAAPELRPPIYMEDYGHLDNLLAVGAGARVGREIVRVVLECGGGA